MTINLKNLLDCIPSDYRATVFARDEKYYTLELGNRTASVFVPQHDLKECQEYLKNRYHEQREGNGHDPESMLTASESLDT